MLQLLERAASGTGSTLVLGNPYARRFILEQMCGAQLAGGTTPAARRIVVREVGGALTRAWQATAGDVRFRFLAKPIEQSLLAPTARAGAGGNAGAGAGVRAAAGGADGEDGGGVGDPADGDSLADTVFAVLLVTGATLLCGDNTPNRVVLAAERTGTACENMLTAAADAEAAQERDPARARAQQANAVFYQVQTAAWEELAIRFAALSCKQEPPCRDLQQLRTADNEGIAREFDAVRASLRPPACALVACGCSLPHANSCRCCASRVVSFVTDFPRRHGAHARWHDTRTGQPAPAVGSRHQVGRRGRSWRGDERPGAPGSARLLGRGLGQ